MNWRLDRMAKVDRNVLRLAVHELLHRPDVPVKVVIDEAIELGKKFGSESSGAFVNGVLDGIRRTAPHGNVPSRMDGRLDYSFTGDNLVFPRSLTIPVWNANAWAFNASGRARPKDRFNEYGAGVGGPVFVPKLYDGRNRSFFFFTYSKDKRPISTSAALSTIPTPRMRNGDFGELPAAQVIYDPGTTAGNVRQPFASNLIPRARFSKIAQNLVSAIPDPTRSSLVGNYDNVNQLLYDRWIWSTKIEDPDFRMARTSAIEAETRTAARGRMLARRPMLNSDARTTSSPSGLS